MFKCYYGTKVAKILLSVYIFLRIFGKSASKCFGQGSIKKQQATHSF